MNESTNAMYFDIHPLVYSLKFGEDFSVPSASNVLWANKKRAQKLAVFHPFYHEIYGTCWSFDFEVLNKTLVEMKEMRINLQVKSVEIDFSA